MCLFATSRCPTASELHIVCVCRHDWVVRCCVYAMRLLPFLIRLPNGRCANAEKKLYFTFAHVQSQSKTARKIMNTQHKRRRRRNCMHNEWRVAMCRPSRRERRSCNGRVLCTFCKAHTTPILYVYSVYLIQTNPKNHPSFRTRVSRCR